MPRPLPTPEEVWRAYDATEARLTAPVSARMIELAGLRPGMHVLDLATGRGEPAIAAAQRVAPGGTVLGVDPSATMLEMTRARAEHEAVSNLTLRVSSAESLDGAPEGYFHATLVRWGLMYMDAPTVALAAARRAMVPRGVLVAALWTEPERVDYFTLPRRVLAKYRALPPIDFDAPGTFRFADLARTEGALAAAGFAIEHVEEMTIPVMEAETDDALIAWTRAFGLTRLLNDLPESTQRSWEQDLVEAAAPLKRDGVVRLGGVTRLVVARSLLGSRDG